MKVSLLSPDTIPTRSVLGGAGERGQHHARGVL